MGFGMGGCPGTNLEETRDDCTLVPHPVRSKLGYHSWPKISEQAGLFRGAIQKWCMSAICLIGPSRSGTGQWVLLLLKAQWGNGIGFWQALNSRRMWSLAYGIVTWPPREGQAEERQRGSPGQGEETQETLVFQTQREWGDLRQVPVLSCVPHFWEIGQNENRKGPQFTSWKAGCFTGAWNHILHLILFLFKRISQGWFFDHALSLGGRAPSLGLLCIFPTPYRSRKVRGPQM